MMVADALITDYGIVVYYVVYIEKPGEEINLWVSFLKSISSHWFHTDLKESD